MRLEYVDDVEKFRYLNNNVFDVAAKEAYSGVYSGVEPDTLSCEELWKAGAIEFVAAYDGSDRVLGYIMFNNMVREITTGKHIINIISMYTSSLGRGTSVHKKMLEWIEEMASIVGADYISSSVPYGSRAQRLMELYGYTSMNINLMKEV